VHFNRLKPCPKNVRLSESNDSGPPRKENNSLLTQEESPTPRPFGINLELIDDDNEETTVATPSQPAPVVTTDQSHSRRYPQRQRHPPVRLNDYVLSAVRDVNSQEGVV